MNQTRLAVIIPSETQTPSWNGALSKRPVRINAARVAMTATKPAAPHIIHPGTYAPNTMKDGALPFEQPTRPRNPRVAAARAGRLFIPRRAARPLPLDSWHEASSGCFLHAILPFLGRYPVRVKC